MAASADRLPLVIGEDRMIPGWEDHLVGLEIGATKGFDITFPDDYRVEDLRGKQAHFEVELLDLREKLLPELTDEFATSVSDVRDPRGAARRDPRRDGAAGRGRGAPRVRRPDHRLRDRQRHG